MILLILGLCRDFDSYAPDFIGGFIGVIGGFLIELSLIQKMRDNKKRETLIGLLNLEFDGILGGLIKNFLNKSAGIGRIYFPIVEDVMDNAENLALFHEYKNGDLLDILRRLNVQLLYYDDTFVKEKNKDKKRLEKTTKIILKLILDFQRISGYYSKDKWKGNGEPLNILINGREKRLIFCEEDSGELIKDEGDKIKIILEERINNGTDNS